MYCVYLTVYFGNKLPRRYIGSSNIKKIKQGYNGSVSSIKWKGLYLEEQLNNKHLFKTRILSTHTTRHLALEEEYRLHIKYNVVSSDLYMNESTARPNGFFGRDVSGENNPMFGRSRKGECHNGGENISKSKQEFYNSERGNQWKMDQSQRISGEGNPMYGKSHTDEIKEKWSKERTGEGNPMYGKSHTDETRLKISKTRREKIESGDIVPWNKGIPMSNEQRLKLKTPRSEETKQKMRKIYCINDCIIVYNAKQYCNEHGMNYACFTQAAKNGKLYKGLTISIISS